MTAEIQVLYDRFPLLAGSAHRVTSPPTDDYNCVGWIRRELKGYYAPGLLWPRDIEVPPVSEPDLPAFVELFRSWGYELCASPEVEPDVQKIAIYERDGFFHHVAKQLRSGAWSSKLGEGHDIRHETLEALYECRVFFNDAIATTFMCRPDDGSEQDVEERGYLLP